MTNQTEQGAAGRFTKKPATIDAWMIDIDNEPRPKWVQLAFASDVIGWCPAGEGLYIDTLEGYMKGKNGDWLIRGVKGELYPCKPDIFAATYEPAGAVSTPEGYTSVKPAAWQHGTDSARVISASTKAQAERDGGASASSVAPYITPLVAVPAGYALVPLEPTEEMLAAAHEGDRQYTLRNFGDVMTVMQGPYDHWCAMVAAATAKDKP